jgi:beta-lactam-binding protein with PASTA domain
LIVRRRRRGSAGRFLDRVDRRWLLRILGVGLVGFLLGYALTALLFLGDGNRDPVVTVPDLRELAIDAARRQAERAGLGVEVGDSLPHASAPAGRVLVQSPLPGREVAPNAAIRVILSTGPERRAIPVVGSLTRQQAERVLSASGFQVQVEEVPNPLPAGRVVGVDPAVGTEVRVPSVVRLRVSAGPPLVAVPDLAGLNEVDARRVLESAGLQLGEVEFEFGGFDAAEAVRLQDPLPGDSIRQGQAVRVWIVSDRLPGIPVR